MPAESGIALAAVPAFMAPVGNTARSTMASLPAWISCKVNQAVDGHGTGIYAGIGREAMAAPALQPQLKTIAAGALTAGRK